MDFSCLEKTIRHKLRNHNNHIVCPDFLTRIKVAFSGISISFQGKNNTVFIKDPENFQKTRIRIVGDNNTVSINASHYKIKNLAVELRHGDNRRVTIGNDFSCESCHILMIEDGSTIEIGNDCMFSHNIQIRNSDSHNIYTNGKLSNSGPKHIHIGNHVWIGLNAVLLKNISVADNTIVGAASVITKKFSKPNTALGGNPAAIIKENINWDRKLGFPN